MEKYNLISQFNLYYPLESLLLTQVKFIKLFLMYIVNN